MQCNKSAGDFQNVQKQDNDIQVTLQETESNSDFHSCTSSTSNQKLLNNLKNHETTQPHTQQSTESYEFIFLICYKVMFFNTYRMFLVLCLSFKVFSFMQPCVATHVQSSL